MFGLGLALTGPGMAQPVITQQPTNQVVVVGGAVTLNVSVSGAGPFSYQWLRYGTDLPYPPTITTVAGNGTNGYSGDGSSAIRAELNVPQNVTVDTAGNLFIADMAGCGAGVQGMDENDQNFNRPNTMTKKALDNKPETSQRCGTCHYFRADRCQRSPPQVVTLGAFHSNSRQPYVNSVG